MKTKNHLLLAIVGSLIIMACGESKPEKQKETIQPGIQLSDKKLEKIKIDVVDSIEDADELIAVGEVSFDEDNIVRVFPIVSGSVEKVEVSLGDYVKKGTLLATIVSTDINQYQVDYTVSKSNLEVAEKNLHRIKELYKSSFASEKELTEAQNEFNKAKSEFEGKKQLLMLYGGSSEENDALFRVNAPIDGYIVERTVNVGTQIRTDNSSNMFIISDLKTVWVWANVYESDMAKVAVGDSVEVTTVAYPDRIYKGSINKIGSTLDPEARIVKARIDIDNPGELLKPEMFATIKIQLKSGGKKLAIPKKAVIIEANKNWVIKAESNNTFVKAEITEGSASKKHIEIVKGLKQGDRIVTEGGLFIASAINNK